MRKDKSFHFELLIVEMINESLMQNYKFKKFKSLLLGVKVKAL